MRNVSNIVFTSLILLGGILFGGCGGAQQPGQNIVDVAHRTMSAAKATTSLTAQSIQEVLHQVDPANYSPSTLTRGIVHFDPLPNGGSITIDFGEGYTADGMTVAGKIVSSFTLTEEALTIQTTFAGAMIAYHGPVTITDPETGEETEEIVDVMLKVDGTLTVEVVLTSTTATCTLRGRLSIDTYKEDVALNFNGVSATLTPLDGTMVFNGPVRIVTQHFGKWRVTFKNLLFRAKIHKGAIDIDSGRVIQERLASLIKWKAVYVFLRPNAGEVTIYPGKITKPFDLAPPPPPEEPVEEPQQ